MYDMHTSVLVLALTSVLVSKSLTDEDRRRISEFLDEEIAALLASGESDLRKVADLVVKNATKIHRQSQGVASRSAQKRELFRRTMSRGMPPDCNVPKHT